LSLQNLGAMKPESRQSPLQRRVIDIGRIGLSLVRMEIAQGGERLLAQIALKRQELVLGAPQEVEMRAEECLAGLAALEDVDEDTSGFLRAEVTMHELFQFRRRGMMAQPPAS